MAPDAHANFAYSLVATAPSPATSGTSLVVTAGQGALFPAVPFNVTIWPASTQPTAANAEIGRCTNISTDTLTITRAEEGTSARTVVVGDQIAATITKKTLTDAESSVAINNQTGTTYTHVLTDSGKLITFNNASAITFTIDSNANVATPVGTVIDLMQLGAGQVTVAITSDTLRATPGAKLRAQYSGATLIKIASTTWALFGDTSA